MEGIRYQLLTLCLRFKELDKLKVKGTDRHKSWLENFQLKKEKHAHINMHLVLSVYKMVVNLHLHG